MLQYIKKELLNNPEIIVNILIKRDFHKPKIRNNEIRCGFEEGSNPTAIQIRLKNNDKLIVRDYVRGLCCDLISYIMKTRKVDFKTVLDSIKQELGIEDYGYFETRHSAFGGFYDRIKRQESDLVAKKYPESVLDEYDSAYSLRFGKDHICAITQRDFQIGYDVLSQRITIPIRNVYGELIGVKGRANWEVGEDEPKYLYLLPCPMSTTLFGYCQNYEYINDQKTILIGESEKFVMQCHSYGIRNCLALGSNSLSNAQCKLLLELSPREVVFVLDKGLDPDITMNNAQRLHAFGRMMDLEIKWWDWTRNTTLEDKASPSDYGKDTMLNILNNEIFEVTFSE